jgi:hypothetical protein
MFPVVQDELGERLKELGEQMAARKRELVTSRAQKAQSRRQCARSRERFADRELRPGPQRVRGRRLSHEGQTLCSVIQRRMQVQGYYPVPWDSPRPLFRP